MAEVISLEDIGENRFRHPVTGVDYIRALPKYNLGTIQGSTIFLSNDPCQIIKYNLDGIIVANVHKRGLPGTNYLNRGQNVITLQDLCNEGYPGRNGIAESNISSGIN